MCVSTSELIEGNEGLIRNQGFYVYRNERLIIHGTWFGIFKYGELSDLVRVKVDIPNSMDHIWQISIDKKDAKLPQNLKVRLKKQLESIHIKSKKVYRRRSTPLNIGDHSSAWTKVKKAGRTKFEINRSSKMVTSLIAKLDDEANESLEFLLRYIEQMLPVNSIVDTHTDTTQEVIQTETSIEARLAAAYIVKTFHGFEEMMRV